MSFSVSSIERDGYLFLTPHGEVTEASIIGLGTEIRRRCDAAGVNNAIIDCAEMTGALPVGRLFSVTPQYVQEVGPTIRVAYINPPADWSVEDDTFSRNVAYNRGGLLELFESEEAAIAWFEDA